MIVEDFIQGSEEWQKARTGIPTSSNFDKLITSKGEPSKSRTKYMYQLAAERITGIKEDVYKNNVMQRGIETEGEARAFYELITGHNVVEVGICYSNDSKLYACSPDGLVGEDGLIEIKCPTSSIHIGYLLANKLPTDYVQQIQGQLFITGRKWCDFFSFYPGIKPLQIRIEPDKNFLTALEVELEVFCKELKELTGKIRR